MSQELGCGFVVNVRGGEWFFSQGVLHRPTLSFSAKRKGRVVFSFSRHGKDYRRLGYLLPLHGAIPYCWLVVKHLNCTQTPICYFTVGSCVSNILTYLSCICDLQFKVGIGQNRSWRWHIYFVWRWHRILLGVDTEKHLHEVDMEKHLHEVDTEKWFAWVWHGEISFMASEWKWCERC